MFSITPIFPDSLALNVSPYLRCFLSHLIVIYNGFVSGFTLLESHHFLFEFWYKEIENEMIFSLVYSRPLKSTIQVVSVRVLRSKLRNIRSNLVDNLSTQKIYEIPAVCKLYPE